MSNEWICVVHSQWLKMTLVYKVLLESCVATNIILSLSSLFSLQQYYLLISSTIFAVITPLSLINAPLQFLNENVQKITEFSVLTRNLVLL